MLTHYRLKQLEEERNKNQQEQPQQEQKLDTEFAQENTSMDYAEMSNQAQEVSEEPVKEQVNQEVKAQQEMPKKK